MDSSSSGSVQYSGGGDEEFESRGDSFSAFLNSCSTSKHAFADMSSFQQQPPPPILPTNHQNHLPSLSDPLSAYFDIFTQSTLPPTANTLLNLDMVLSRGFTSATSSSHDTATLMASPAYRGQQALPHATPIPNPSSTPSFPSHENSLRARAPSDPSSTVAPNPKKRSRASRRAPTTVLTTDTSNFRSMVQEFTGIPAPPFSTSPLLGSRLNLFGPSMRPGLEPPLPYPSRPFAHKVMPQSLMTSSTINPFASRYDVGATANTTATTTARTTICSNTYNPIPAYNYQLLSELVHPRQSQNLSNMQSSVLSHQQSVQPSPRHPLPTVPYFGAKTPTSSTMDSVLENSTRRGHLNSTGHLGNAADSLNDEWAPIEEQR